MPWAKGVRLVNRARSNRRLAASAQAWFRLLTGAGVGILVVFLIGLLRGPGDSALAGNSVPTKIREDLIMRSEALLKRDAQLVASKVAGRLDMILDPMFAAYHQRIPDFAAWAFRWRTSYSLLRRGVVTAITLPFADPPRLQRFGAAWDDLIATKFDELVLRPEGGAAALRSARHRWETEATAILNAMVTNTFLTAALLRGQDPSPRTWRPLVPEEVAGNEAMPLLAAISAASSLVKIHAVRPLLTRLTLRPPVAATVTAVGETLSGYGNIAFLGTVSGMLATVAGFLSIDYLISRAEAAIHQESLEKEIHRVLDSQYDKLRRTWLSAMQADINAQLHKAHDILQGDLPQGARTGWQSEHALW